MLASRFPGFPGFLEAAAAEIGHPEAAGPARRIAALTGLANLCAQAADAADAARAAAILEKAEEFLAQLRAATLASERMVCFVRGAGETGAEAPDLAAGRGAADRSGRARAVRGGTPR